MTSRMELLQLSRANFPIPNETSSPDSTPPSPHVDWINPNPNHLSSTRSRSFHAHGPSPRLLLSWKLFLGDTFQSSWTPNHHQSSCRISFGRTAHHFVLCTCLKFFIFTPFLADSALSLPAPPTVDSSPQQLDPAGAGPRTLDNHSVKSLTEPAEPERTRTRGPGTTGLSPV